MRIAAVLLLLGILLAVTPTVYSHEWASFKWSCHRSGEHAGECYAEPTLRDWLITTPAPTKTRRIRAYDTMQLDAIESTFPREDGIVLLLPTCDDTCWKEREGKSPEAIKEQIDSATREIQVTVSGEPVLVDEMRSFIDGFEAFRKDRSKDTFEHHPVASYRSWWLLLYLGAAFLFALAYSRFTSVKKEEKKKTKTRLAAGRAKGARSRA